jgi:hypothetical protein
VNARSGEGNKDLIAYAYRPPPHHTESYTMRRSGTNSVAACLIYSVSRGACRIAPTNAVGDVNK